MLHLMLLRSVLMILTVQVVAACVRAHTSPGAQIISVFFFSLLSNFPDKSSAVTVTDYSLVSGPAAGGQFLWILFFLYRILTKPQ